MPIQLNAFLQDDHVTGFIEYMVSIISGGTQINHQYRDRYLNRLHPDNRNGHNPDRDFQTLEDAFHGYYWPNPEGAFESNYDDLERLKVMLRDARQHGSNERIDEAISQILWWGAGNREAPLYTHNKRWLDQYVNAGNTVIRLLDSADNAFGMDPFDENIFDGINMRSNAGFTKVYALGYDDFIIYDSRVAAALGLLVVNYCMQCNLRGVPDYLNISIMNAAGQDNRDPSRGNYIFLLARNHALHARSNWIANTLLLTAVDRLNEAGQLPGWVGDRGEALRRIEAALFMLGKHIHPQAEIQSGTDYRIQVETVQSGADDDAGWSVLATLGRRVNFIWRRNDEERIELRFGAGNGRQLTFDGNVIQRISDYFNGRGWFPIGASHLNSEERTEGSLGRWLSENAGITLNIASYVASLLVEEGVANYRVSMRRGEIEIAG